MCPLPPRSAAGASWRSTGRRSGSRGSCSKNKPISCLCSTTPGGRPRRRTGARPACTSPRPSTSPLTGPARYGGLALHPLQGVAGGQGRGPLLCLVSSRGDPSASLTVPSHLSADLDGETGGRAAPSFHPCHGGGRPAQLFSRSCRVDEVSLGPAHWSFGDKGLFSELGRVGSQGLWQRCWQSKMVARI